MKRRSHRGPSLTRRALLGVGAGGAATWLLRKRVHAAPPPMVVDVHSHNFNASDLPIEGFTAHFIPFLSDVSRELTDLPEQLFRDVARQVEKALGLVAPSAKVELAQLTANPGAPWPSPVRDEPRANDIADRIAETARWLFELVGHKVDVKTVVRRAAQVVNLIARSRSAITSTLVDTYQGVDLFVPMLVDYDGWAGSHAASALGDQIVVHGALAQKSILSPMGSRQARLHPFVAFDPKRADGLTLVQTAIEQHGFVGVKVYPPVGFAPANNACLLTKNQPGAAIDAALDALYKYCAANDVPITTHCSTGNEFGRGYRDLVAPRRWEPVLASYPKLRLNLGHFGHSEGALSSRGFRACEAWIRQATSLMERYDNVYGDLSGSAFNETSASAAAYATLVQAAFARAPAKITKRIMYGSDWWLSRFFDGSATYLDDFKTSFARLFPARNDLLADVLGNNALCFLGFKDGGGARSGNGERLAKLYKAANQPAPQWLGK